ncbi:MAG: hypothetical protein AB1733_21060 [Thermodesulfobacteriota bacterium]
MKTISRFSIFLIAIAATLAVGCAPALKSAKLDAPSDQGPAEQSAPATGTEPSQPLPPVSQIEKPRPPLATGPSQQPGLGKPAPPATPGESLEREEVNKAALEFAKGIPEVLHIKTCFSKMFGGWYLDLFIKKTKKTAAIQNYAWNPTTREWEVSVKAKEIPLNEVENYLKGQVGDEKCSILK